MNHFLTICTQFFLMHNRASWCRTERTKGKSRSLRLSHFDFNFRQPQPEPLQWQTQNVSPTTAEIYLKCLPVEKTISPAPVFCFIVTGYERASTDWKSSLTPALKTRCAINLTSVLSSVAVEYATQVLHFSLGRQCITFKVIHRFGHLICRKADVFKKSVVSRGTVFQLPSLGTTSHTHAWFWFLRDYLWCNKLFVIQ